MIVHECFSFLGQAMYLLVYGFSFLPLQKSKWRFRRFFQSKVFSKASLFLIVYRISSNSKLKK